MTIEKYKNAQHVDVHNIFNQYFNDPEFLSELDESLKDSEAIFYVLTEYRDVISVVGVRKVTNYLLEHAKTENPLELYIIASKYKGAGAGSKLCDFIIKEAKFLGYTEIICYSPETHETSWKFYEHIGFVSGGIVNDPDDGYPGMLWRKVL